MLLKQILYSVMLLLSCGYAIFAGGKPGRYFVIILILGSFLSINPFGYYPWQSINLYVFFVDILCFICFAALAMRYNRGWLIWCSGLQLASITTHMATIIAPDFSPAVYFALAEFWSIPIILLMVWGVSLDRKIDAK